MRTVTIFLILSSLGLLSGCSTTTMNRIMSSWEGEHIESAFSQWGYPDEEKEIRDHKLYIWHYSKSFYMPQNSTTTGHIYGNSFSANTYTTGGYSIQGYCTRILEVDNSGYIVRWQWEGNDCPFMEIFEYSSWRNKK